MITDPQCYCGQICTEEVSLDDEPTTPLGWCLCCDASATTYSKNGRMKWTWDNIEADWGDWEWAELPSIAIHITHPMRTIIVIEKQVGNDA